jgi:hypothetical protein
MTSQSQWRSSADADLLCNDIRARGFDSAVSITVIKRVQPLRV